MDLTIFNFALSIDFFFCFSFTDEPEYWWFELMVLLNKTLMCGGLVVLAPGSTYQILGAILIMLFHLLVVLKLAPFVKDSEDWASVLSTLGLCLTSLGAYSMLLKTDEDELNLIGGVLVGICIFCIAIILCIMIFVDCGLWNRCRRKKEGKEKRRVNTTQVKPSKVVEEDGEGVVRDSGEEKVEIMQNNFIPPSLM